MYICLDCEKLSKHLGILEKELKNVQVLVEKCHELEKMATGDNDLDHQLCIELGKQSESLLFGIREKIRIVQQIVDEFFIIKKYSRVQISQANEILHKLNILL